mgnify:CR=1 FL=1
MAREKMIKTLLKEFIVNNGLDLSGKGSELNGNCVILAGYLCYIVSERELGLYEGIDAIKQLELSTDSTNELIRVFDFAYISSYEHFWTTKDAKDKYKF